MDLASHKFHSTPSLSPLTSPPLSLFPSPAAVHPSHTSFPIIAVAVIGILATAFLLVSYYIFVIKCCLNWHRIDLLRRFSFSRRRSSAAEDPLVPYSSAVANRGLNEAAIRSIPIFKFQKSDAGNQNSDAKSCECAVCLNEFHEGEKLRAIPNCGHLFHTDCIDIWLQNNANCPLCRVSISAARLDPMYRGFGPGPYPRDPNSNVDSFIGRDEDYVVIEIGSETVNPSSTLPRVDEETSSNELILSISPSPRKIETTKISRKKSKKFSHASSMGDECIDNRRKDDLFVVQPIRRSFSMDSAADSQLYLAVQEIIQRHGHVNSNNSNEINQNEGCSTSRGRRSFFSFGQGRASRNAVQPVSLEPRG